MTNLASRSIVLLDRSTASGIHLRWTADSLFRRTFSHQVPRINNHLLLNLFQEKVDCRNTFEMLVSWELFVFFEFGSASFD
jgi:hypothetical protein